jgi:hypothetical protein
MVLALEYVDMSFLQGQIISNAICFSGTGWRAENTFSEPLPGSPAIGQVHLRRGMDAPFAFQRR